MIDGDAVVHELVLPAPAEQVFGMFTDPRQLVRWNGVSADRRPTGGGDPAPYPGGEPAGRLPVLRGQHDGTGSSRPGRTP